MMNVAQPIPKMTLAEFEALSKEEHLNYELIDGLVMMSPSPSFDHQKIADCPRSNHLRAFIRI